MCPLPLQLLQKGSEPRGHGAGISGPSFGPGAVWQVRSLGRGAHFLPMVRRQILLADFLTFPGRQWRNKGKETCMSLGTREVRVTGQQCVQGIKSPQIQACVPGIWRGWMLILCPNSSPWWERWAGPVLFMGRTVKLILMGTGQQGILINCIFLSVPRSSLGNTLNYISFSFIT